MELTLRMRNFIPRETHPFLFQVLPNQVPSRWRNMIILLPEDHDHLPLDVPSSLQAIIPSRAQAPGMYICSEIANSCRNTWIESTAVGEMSAKTHACCADAAIGSGKGEEMGDC